MEPMSRSRMKESYALLKKDGQSFADYYRQEVQRCREQVRAAIDNAPRDGSGKPVFYTICRHVSRSGMSRMISLYYFDLKAGRMLHLNYACPSQKLKLGADHADLVPSRERGREDSMAG